MSDPQEEEEENPALSALLKRSLKAPEEEAPAPAEEQKLLENVQRKIRQRSKGKFYNDGWSTTQSRINYMLIAGIMLATVIAVYLALGPTGISR